MTLDSPLDKPAILFNIAHLLVSLKTYRNNVKKKTQNSTYQKIWKTQQCHRTGKGQFSFFFFQCYSSILFIRQQENPRLEEKRVEECVGRERERERERERASTHAHRRESPRESALAPPFICFFLHLGLPYANWAQPGVLFVLPEVFTLVLGPSFDLPCLLAAAILDSFSLFYLPNSRTASLIQWTLV